MNLFTKSIAAIAAALSISFTLTTTANAEEGFIDVSTGQVLHYIAEGKPGKPLLLFIHGGPERADVWADYLKAFSRDYYAVAYTTRGYFPSSEATEVEDFTVTALATDTKAIAEALGYDTFTVVGHDWGGATAWRAALNYPESVERAIIFSNPHPVNYARAYYEVEKHRELLDAYVPAARADEAPWTREGSMDNNFEHFKDYVYTEKAQQRIRWSIALDLEETWGADEGRSLDALYNHYKALSWPLPALPSCNAIPGLDLAAHQPILVLYGEQDRFTAGESFRLPNDDCAPNAKYVKYKNGDHWIHHTHKYNAIWQMKRFLRKTN